LAVLGKGHLSTNSWAVFSAMSVDEQACRDAVFDIITDENENPHLRASAIWAVSNHANDEGLRVLADRVADTTPAQRSGLMPAFDETFPFYHNPIAAGYRITVQTNSEANSTIGSIAISRLKTLTGQDFGDDVGAWRQWIEAQEDSPE
jgi:hypothetical protein